MSFWNRNRTPVDRIASENLASYGRHEFLKEESGINSIGVYGLISDLNELVFTQNPVDRATVIAELSRHAEKGEWEKVGAWKYVRDFLDDSDDTYELIRDGLLALQRMCVTNLAIHLSERDQNRYREVTGGAVPHDGFWGPPVFASHFGPSRQYYLDNAVAVAARRTITRSAHRPGVVPDWSDAAASAMWDFGMLVHRGPLVVPSEIQSEADVIAPAVAVADGADHLQFLQLMADRVFEPDSYLLGGPWAMIGGARFAEDYLGPETLRTAEFRRLLDAGLGRLDEMNAFGVIVAVEVLTPIQQERLRQIRHDR